MPASLASSSSLTMLFAFFSACVDGKRTVDSCTALHV